jgi:hypothetical protein
MDPVTKKLCTSVAKTTCGRIGRAVGRAVADLGHAGECDERDAHEPSSPNDKIVREREVGRVRGEISRERSHHPERQREFRTVTRRPA